MAIVGPKSKEKLRILPRFWGIRKASVCKFVKIASNLLGYTNNITIEDYGEGIYPRYFFQLIATPDEGFKENGCYELWEKDDAIGQLYFRIKTHYDKYYKQDFYFLDLPYDDVYVKIQGEKSTDK